MVIPRIVVIVQGGMVTDIYSDGPAEVRVLDYDIEQATLGKDELLPPLEELKREKYFGWSSLAIDDRATEDKPIVDAVFQAEPEETNA